MNTKKMILALIAAIIFILSTLPLNNVCANVESNISTMVIDVLNRLGFYGEQASIYNLEKALGLPPQDIPDSQTVEIISELYNFYNSKEAKKPKEIRLQKSENGYEIVVIERIPVSEDMVRGLCVNLKDDVENEITAQLKKNKEIWNMEKKMMDLINKERKTRGLNPLKFDPELSKTARLKSQDIVENNYFSHNSPKYGTPFEMMKEFGITYLWAGENLAGAPTVEIAHKNLMASKGHRKNILHSEFTHVGIGIAKGSPYQLVFTQHFIGK